MQKKSSLASMVMSKDENENEKGGQTDNRMSRTQRDHRRRVLEKQHAPHDA